MLKFQVYVEPGVVQHTVSTFISGSWQSAGVAALSLCSEEVLPKKL